ncbi:hypothetical protein E4U13_002277 [Claviceps humidiphila]|uniref:Uncharacterized protein n=1 Tax=Claviceps humidiphila TaxID=1294629 RepID=A0A9P7QDB2_9HYPO|nr:hypothetical protein E4U13_002277 [Claviceps humidiphila]
MAREAGMMLFRGLPGIIQGPRIQGATGRLRSMQQQQQQQHVAHAPYTYYIQRSRDKSSEPTDYDLVVSKLTRPDDNHMNLSVADELQGQILHDGSVGNRGKGL